MKFDSFDGGRDDEYNGVGLVKIPQVFVTQDEFFHGVMLLDRLLHESRKLQLAESEISYVIFVLCASTVV